ncbi:MAG: hypothetical protein JSR66_20165 [Proteobacteria bacterium]|nr:hypothetical protein [Pseudomonadota bacterium]
MKLRIVLGVLYLSSAAAIAVAQDSSTEAAAAVEQTLSARSPLLIQAGSNLLLKSVTDDNYAIYQDGRTVYAQKLVPGARRHVIAEVQNNDLSDVQTIGKVALVFSDPQRNFPGFGVSPLFVWTAAGGAHRISDAATDGLVAVDVSPDNQWVLYQTNVTGAGGLVGDLAIVDVLGKHQQTLLKQIPLDFPSGLCRPLAAFVGPPGQAVPAAVYCAGTDTTATLSRWVHGRRVDLINDIKTPLPFALETNPQETEFFVRLHATGDPVIVTDRGSVRTVDQVGDPRKFPRGFLTDRGAAVYTAQPSAAGPVELRLAARGQAPITVASQFAFPYVRLFHLGSYPKIRTPSPDGRLVLYATSFDPVTFASDLNLLDLHTGSTTVVDSQQQNFAGVETFTADSRYGMYSSIAGALLVTDRFGAARQINEDNTVFRFQAATGSVVAFNDHMVFNSAPADSFELSTGDLRVVDAGRPNTLPRLVAPQVHLQYFASYGGRGVVFTSDAAARPGLYLASSRP